MFNFEELSEKIVKFMYEYNWYDMNDNYGNIETDSDARKFAFEETYKTLVNKPNDILERLLFFKEEMEENYELYSDLISLISEVEELINIDRKIDL